MTKMTAEQPALGISRSEVWNDAEVYHVECTCTDPSHSIDAWVELRGEDDIGEVEVTFYVTTNFKGWLNIGERLKIAWKVLTGSGYEQSHSMLLKKQSALNFSAALEASIEDLESRDTDSQSN